MASVMAMQATCWEKFSVPLKGHQVACAQRRTMSLKSRSARTRHRARNYVVAGVSKISKMRTEMLSNNKTGSEMPMRCPDTAQKKMHTIRPLLVHCEHPRSPGTLEIQRHIAIPRKMHSSSTIHHSPSSGVSRGVLQSKLSSPNPVSSFHDIYFRLQSITSAYGRTPRSRMLKTICATLGFWPDGPCTKDGAAKNLATVRQGWLNHFPP